MKNTGSKVRKILILTLTAVLVIGLYYFCSRKEKDNNDKISSNDPYSVIVSRDLELNYPSTPKAVVTFYSDILQQIYLDELNDDQVEALAKQARGLFDTELLALNEYDTYLANLMKKAGIAKGYGEDVHIWAICFWLGIMGYLYVIALPDKIQQSQNQKIIELLEGKK